MSDTEKIIVSPLLYLYLSLFKSELLDGVEMPPEYIARVETRRAKEREKDYLE